MPQQEIGIVALGVVFGPYGFISQLENALWEHGRDVLGGMSLENRGIVTGHRWVRKQDMAKTMRREMTPEESLLWTRLRSNRCGGLHFRRQQVIDGFIADFYCHAVGLIVEVDGSIHEQQADYDLARDRVLVGRSLRVIRFSNDRIHEDLENVVAEIQAFAAAATQANDLPENEIGSIVSQLDSDKRIE